MEPVGNAASCEEVRPGIDSGWISPSCMVVRFAIVVVLRALTPSELKFGMSVETSGKAVLYAVEALEPLAVTEKFCILSNRK